MTNTPARPIRRGRYTDDQLQRLQTLWLADAVEIEDVFPQLGESQIEMRRRWVM